MKWRISARLIIIKYHWNYSNIKGIFILIVEITGIENEKRCLSHSINQL